MGLTLQTKMKESDALLEILVGQLIEARYFYDDLKALEKELRQQRSVLRGKWMKHRRVSLGLTQLQVGKGTGISQGRISDIENGRKIIHDGEMKLIYEFYNSLEQS